MSKSRSLRLVCLASVAATAGLILSGVALSQDQVAAGHPPIPPKGAKSKPGPRRFPEFKDVTKDMKATTGLFTLYRYPASDTTHDTERLLCRIPKSLLSQDLLFATSITSGGQFTGYMWRSYLIRWEIRGKKLMMITPDTRYVHKKGKPVEDVIKRTYTARYIATAPIVTMAGGDPVIDLGSLLKSNIADVSFMGGGVNGELSKWNKIKVFPDNVLIDVELALGGRRGGKMVGVGYAFRRLPKSASYRPRKADDRIGYFVTTRMDWTRKHEARDTYDRYINRWKLEKRDPSLELSPPVKPITFYIEKTVPVRWRRWVAAGILEWNKAFEKIGYSNAIVVQQQTADNAFADYDPEDARYNFFRWIVSGRAFAMGPSRVDPRTGQILDADIIMDDSFVRAYMYDFDLFAPSAMAELKGPEIQLWSERYPELAAQIFPHLLAAPVDERTELIRLANRKLQANGQYVCNYATGFQQQMALVYDAIIATSTGKKIPERFLGEAIKEVVTHEIGHTLGLRHNFKASSWLTLDEIKKRRDTTDKPTCASVMDYNPLLFFAGDKPEKMHHFITTGIGPYDYWAIEYGYATPKKGESEAKMLKEIASRCTQPGHDYATDEDTMGSFSPDPSSNRFDMGADPRAWADSRIKLADQLLPTLLEWSVKKGEPRYFARRAFQTLWFEKARNFAFVARVVGGEYFHRDHKGDPDARPAFVPVEPAKQRAALKKIARTVLSDEFYRFDPKVLNELAPSRWGGLGRWPATSLDFPVHDWIMRLQSWTLVDLLSPPVFQRIYDGQLKSTAKDKFTAAEYIETLRDAVWTELKHPRNRGTSDAHPMISSSRRNLQRAYLDVMIAYARLRPGAVMSPDLTSMFRQSLRELSAQIEQVAKKRGGWQKIDFATRAHLVDCKSRIDRALKAQFIDN